ncbi:MAG: tetratricopeptide repeat protein [Planctomycetaceae bacterium]
MHRPLSLTVSAAMLCAMLGVSPTLRACINTNATNLKGETVIAEGGHHSYIDQLQGVKPVDIEWWTEAEKQAAAKVAEDPSIENRIDHAACLIYLGEYDRAIEMLNAVEEEAPGNYMVATNLGTAYELKGDNEQALQWIETGIERNPESHNGSEWIHVAILRAKLRDPNSEESVLGVSFGDAPEPVAPSAESFATIGAGGQEELAYHIQTQLLERLQFVSAPNPIVGELLFDMANAIALSESLEESIPIYEMAAEYGYSKSELLAARKKHLLGVIARNPQSGTRMGDVSVAAVGTVLVVIGVVFLLAVVAVVYGLYWLLNRRRQA